MTMIRLEPVRCVLCEEETPNAILDSTSTFGPPDLDLRPAEPARRSLFAWIQRCEACGYCAPSIGTATPYTSEIVEGVPYRAVLDDASYPHLARAFLCSSIVFEQTGEEAAAARNAIEAAWACDDKGATEAARRCRLRAAMLLRDSQGEGDELFPDAATENAVLVDLLRRAGRFDEAVEGRGRRARGGRRHEDSGGPGVLARSRARARRPALLRRRRAARRGGRRRVALRLDVVVTDASPTTSEEPVLPVRARHPLGEPLQADTVQAPRRRMHREPRQQLLQVPARLAVAALGSGRDRADEVGALKADRVVARAEEEALDDPVEPRVRAAVLRQVGEEAAQPCVVLAEAAVDDDHADVVVRLEQQLEALRQEHQARRVGVLVGREELGRRRRAQLDVEQRHVTADRRPAERVDDRISESGRNVAGPDPVPLDLAIGWPPVRGERRLPDVAQRVPVAVAKRNAAESEEAALGELSGLVEEEQVHVPIGTPGTGRRQAWPYDRRPVRATPLNRLDGAVFVAHNASFDLAMLQHELARVDIEHRPVGVACILAALRLLDPRSAVHRLEPVSSRHGVVLE